MLTMVIGGLWHGAAWTFVLWGAWHGLALVVHKIWKGNVAVDGPPLLSLVYGFAARIATLLVVLVGWVLFRSESLSKCILILRKMFFGGGGLFWPYPFAVVVLCGMFGYHVLRRYGGPERFLRLHPASPFSAALLLFMLGLSLVFRPTGFQPFIYFQF